MAEDAQVPNEDTAEARLSALRREFLALRDTALAEGDGDQDEAALLQEIEDKLAQAEQMLAPPEGSDGPAEMGYTTDAVPFGAEDTPPDEAPEASVPASIAGSVGTGGRNAPDDVQAVQHRLNQNGASLTVDGLIGPKTVGAIAAFQREALGFADGRVDPGGQTWQALVGGSAAAPPPAGFDDDLKSLIDELPTEEPPRPTIQNEERADDEGPVGVWVGVETSIELGPLTFKVATDDKGRVTGGGLELARKVDTPPIGMPPYYFGCGAAIFGEASMKGPGPRVDVFFKIGGKGVGYLGVGPAAGGAVAGFKVEVELNGICDAPFDAILDLESPSASEAFFGLPLTFSLGGVVKAGAEIRAGDFGISEMVPIREYKEFVFLRIENGPDYLLSTGPGFDQFINDIKNLHKKVIDAVELGKKNPKLAGTGDTGPLLVDKANSASDDIHRVADQALIAALRAAEQNMQAAFQAGWATPTLLGKANALTQQNEDLAREIYGQAWTQRALAKQSYDQYGSPLDSAPLEIVEARLAQAMSIANQFNGAVALFHAGDARW